MKEVCYQKSATSCEAFVKKKKLYPKPIDTPAICYGNDESVAI